MNYDYYVFAILFLYWIYQIRHSVADTADILDKIDTTLSEMKQLKESELEILRDQLSGIKNELREMRLGEWRPINSEKENHLE